MTHKEYKSPKAILRHTKEFLEDPTHWTQEAFSQCISLPFYTEWEDRGAVEQALRHAAPLVDFKKYTTEELRELNEECTYCVLGAVGYFDAAYEGGQENGVLENPAGRLVEQAARELYGTKTELREYENDWTHAQTFSIAVAVNDGEKHTTPLGAYKATMRILDRAIELAPK